MSNISCPYGAESCPKVEELEARMDKVETHLSNMNAILWAILGVAMASLCGIVAVLI